MSKPLEDYGFIGNAVSAALVARDGSIDWLCLPHFDSPACFAALLGDYEHGHWQIEPAVSVRRVRRRYRPGTAVLETTFETARGTVTLIDFMPFTDDERYVDVVRVVRGDRGRVPMRMRLALRFDYGRVVPWVRRQRYGISAVAGPDALQLRTPVPLVGRNMHTEADFDVEGGSEVPFTLAWHPSHLRPRRGHDEAARLAAVTRRWQTWSQHCTVGHPIKPAWHEALTRSLVTLKSLTYAPTGGIVAAPTTSLPEEPGGERNWDYRLCWIRDATLTLYALLTSGYRYEARAWRDWLLRAAAGDPAQLRVLYGLNGTQRLPELELQWLPGYADSRPVRVGNAAQDQYQLDVPGELMDTLHVGRRLDLAPNRADWDLQRTILERLERHWQQPDQGIWEVRGVPRHFTHSRVMCWVAFDRGIKAVEMYGLPGPVERWRGVRNAIHADVWRNGWNVDRQSFVQYYGSDAVDASLLLMASVGFVHWSDPRFVATVAAIERDLLVDGLVLRYRSRESVDGLPGREGVFLACSFWLVDAYVMLGRHNEAVALFESLLRLRNDVGLLAEEYDPRTRRLVGNFPQAFSHIALINTVHNLVSRLGPASHRAEAAPADAQALASSA